MTYTDRGAQVTAQAMILAAALLLTAGPLRADVADPFSVWLATDFPVADGFDVASRDTDADNASDVRAVANGRVALARDCGVRWGNVVLIDHVFYENYERREIRSSYRHVREVAVKPGDVVHRGDVIAHDARTGHGPPAHLHLEPRGDRPFPAPSCPSSEVGVDPRPFLRAHRELPVPQAEAALALVDTTSRRMRLYLDGKDVATFEVGFGQGEGRKRRQGDLRTPLGMYYVTEKSRGPFPGRWGGFYGGHWIKLDYPNAFDAAWGRASGLLTAPQERRIAESWARRKPTWEGSPLGGGIGFHGWIGGWDLAGPRRLSWGCVVMRNADIAALFDRIPVGTMVVIL
jgi:lipoprotein-anchoring transpeptidase ErfK/SrfK